MITPDSIEPVPFLILMIILVTTWLAIGIRDRRRARRARDLVDQFVLPNLCSLLWVEGSTWCICTRPDEHTGPHLDSIQHIIRR